VPLPALTIALDETAPVSVRSGPRKSLVTGLALAGILVAGLAAIFVWREIHLRSHREHAIAEIQKLIGEAASLAKDPAQASAGYAKYQEALAKAVALDKADVIGAIRTEMAKVQLTLDQQRRDREAEKQRRQETEQRAAADEQRRRTAEKERERLAAEAAEQRKADEQRRASEEKKRLEDERLAEEQKRDIAVQEQKREYLQNLAKAREFVAAGHRSDAAAEISKTASSQDVGVLSQALKLAAQIKNIALTASFARQGLKVAPSNRFFAGASASAERLADTDKKWRESCASCDVLRSGVQNDRGAIGQLQDFVNNPNYYETVREQRACDRCEGRGRLWGGQTYSIVCPVCHGRKKVTVVTQVQRARDTQKAQAELHRRQNALRDKEQQLAVMTARAQDLKDTLDQMWTAIAASD
jgi:hypothetical protein